MTNITQDDAALAGEYVLGLLDNAAFAQASARVATDTDFAAEVRSWQERLIPLLDTDDQTVVPDLWPQIEARIMPETGQDHFFRIRHCDTGRHSTLKKFLTTRIAEIRISRGIR